MRTTAFLTTILALAASALGAEHPRLLISPADLARIRHAAGAGAAGDASFGAFGRRRADVNALRGHFAAMPADTAELALPGETVAAAALSLVIDDAAQVEILRGRVKRSLESPSVFADEWLERIIALDWTWEGIDPQTRANFIASLRQRIQSFEPSDSPTHHETFRERLVGLAAVVAFDETDDATSNWRETRKRVLDAAKTYFADVFPAYLRARGGIPTSPGMAGLEESDIILAIELASRLPDGPKWSDFAAAGRLLEHYVVAGSQHPALRTQFLRDDARTAAATPASAWESMLPLTAHLLAVRTRDPSAAAVANGVEHRIGESREPLVIAPWRWVPLFFDAAGIAAADPRALPAARNLDGAIVFRGGSEPLSRIVWVDAGQKLLSSSQAFDAGGFLVRSGGELAVSAADSLWKLAVPDRKGVQRLGPSSEPFDYGQFASASIAHNCLIVFEATRMARWRGRIYAPIGGQKPVEGDFREFLTPVESQGRAPSTLTAYGVDGRSAYAAIDLSAAYDDRNLKRYTREMLWLGGAALLVVDRVELTDPRARPTWVLNLPARPLVGGRELPPEMREAGAENSAGVWRYAGGADGVVGAEPDAARLREKGSSVGWIRTHDRDGALWITPVLPLASTIALVGGPARAETTTILEPRPVTYVGSGPEGFEHRVLPSRQPRNENAWYRVEDVPSFAGQYARSPHWGRLEIEAERNTPMQTFVTLLVPTGSDGAAPALVVEAGEPIAMGDDAGDGSLTLRLTVGGQRVGATVLVSPRRSDPPTIFDGERKWTPRASVEPDAPLPTK